jgi:hypothetical protein
MKARKRRSLRWSEHNDFKKETRKSKTIVAVYSEPCMRGTANLHDFAGDRPREGYRKDKVRG